MRRNRTRPDVYLSDSCPDLVVGPYNYPDLSTINVRDLVECPACEFVYCIAHIAAVDNTAGRQHLLICPACEVVALRRALAAR